MSELASEPAIYVEQRKCTVIGCIIKYLSNQHINYLLNHHLTDEQSSSERYNIYLFTIGEGDMTTARTSDGWSLLT